MSDRLRVAAKNLLETAESIRVEGRVKPQDAADLITDCKELRAALAEPPPLLTNDEARDVLDVLCRNGFVRCDIPACSCGSWHHRFGYPERFREIRELLEAHDVNTNGVTLLNAIKTVLEARTHQPQQKREPLTDAEIASACLSYRHDFGLWEPREQRILMHEAREWDRVLRKEYGDE